ncbi:MAG: DUF1343 domain-containing protein [Bacteroidales bacterium]|nr:DUF1343 domain-containing protein [Bacteroidales bacterium]
MQLKGKRIGLVTNPTGVDARLRSTIDILNDAPGVKLVALFGPEHGVRGNSYAGMSVSGDSKDPETGITVYSLYGRHRMPTPEMLKGLDAVVYDIQDNGCRSYTFINTLGLLMEACARQGVEVIVLDRPDPLGGEKVEGCLVEPGCFSFVSMYDIPYVYGLTVGELATMLNEEHMIKGEDGTEENVPKCNLTVVPMEGWHRSMTYEQTGLPWVLPSPHIPQTVSACSYPASGILGELGYVSIGVGYTLPFQMFAAPWIDGNALSAELNSYHLPGVIFRPLFVKPFYSVFAGQNIGGVQFYFTDYGAARITEIQFYVMQAIAALYPQKKVFDNANITRFNMFDKVCGSKYIREKFSKNNRFSDIRDYWRKDEESFRLKSVRYYIYD